MERPGYRMFLINSVKQCDTSFGNSSKSITNQVIMSCPVNQIRAGCVVDFWPNRLSNMSVHLKCMHQTHMIMTLVFYISQYINMVTRAWGCQFYRGRCLQHEYFVHNNDNNLNTAVHDCQNVTPFSLRKSFEMIECLWPE